MEIIYNKTGKIINIKTLSFFNYAFRVVTLGLVYKIRIVIKVILNMIAYSNQLLVFIRQVVLSVSPDHQRRMSSTTAAIFAPSNFPESLITSLRCSLSRKETENISDKRLCGNAAAPPPRYHRTLCKVAPTDSGCFTIYNLTSMISLVFKAGWKCYARLPALPACGDPTMGVNVYAMLGLYVIYEVSSLVVEIFGIEILAKHKRKICHAENRSDV